MLSGFGVLRKKNARTQRWRPYWVGSRGRRRRGLGEKRRASLGINRVGASWRLGLNLLALLAGCPYRGKEFYGLE